MKHFSIIAAVDNRFGLGRGGRLPWHLKADMKFFKDLTLGTMSPGRTNAVVMGRVTWESLPERFRPLPGRKNVVLSTKADLVLPPEVLLANSLDQALSQLATDSSIEQVFVIGGANVYAQALGHGSCRKIFLTRLDADYQCDVFFPQNLSGYQEIFRGPVQSEGDIRFFFSEWQRR